MFFYAKHNVLGIKISACDEEYILDKIEDAVTINKNLLICPTTTFSVALAYKDPSLAKTLNSYDFVVPDSYWLTKTLQFLYKVDLGKRLYGPDLMLAICKLSEKKGYKVLFYGTKKSVLKKLEINIKKKFPRLKISGLLPGKYRNLKNVEKKNLIADIKKSKARIIFVGLGEPRQVTFSFELLNKNPKLNGSFVVVPVGAAFDFLSGEKSQAPVWIRDNGLEWLYRLMSEPGRLWKRYLIYAPFFVISVIKQKLKI